jgi:hypothetical protein
MLQYCFLLFWLRLHRDENLYFGPKFTRFPDIHSFKIQTSCCILFVELTKTKNCLKFTHLISFGYLKILLSHEVQTKNKKL